MQNRVDPGFPVGGGSNPPGGDRQYTNLSDFPQKMHKIKKILIRRGSAHQKGVI